MSCREMRRLLSFRREWTAAEGAEARAHLESCLACQAVARQYELMDLRLGRLPAPAMEVRLPARVRLQPGVGEAGAPVKLALSAGRAAVLLALLATILVVATAWPTLSPGMPFTQGRTFVGELPPAARLVPQGTGVEGRAEHPTTTPVTPLRPAIITYTMGISENVWSVARHFGLKPETVLWANVQGNEHDPDVHIVAPQRLIVLPVDGALYTVQPGDTLEKVALRHRVSEEAITGFALNGLEEPYELQPGQQLIVPGATRFYTGGVSFESPFFSNDFYPKDAPKGSGTFAWPTVGYLSQGYWSGHYAIDIANETGTPVVAADHGYVIVAGRDTWGYGNQVLIGHGNGFMTRYAHLDTMLLRTGDVVSKGQQIGTMGSTGNATTPHLHFEIIEEGLRRNPLGYLP